MPAPKGNQYAKEHRGRGPEKYTQEWIRREAKIFKEWMKDPEAMFFKSFCLERGYSPQRLYEFADKNEVFAECLALAKTWQEVRLVNYGLFNKINVNLVKFVLANCRGWNDYT